MVVRREGVERRRKAQAAVLSAPEQRHAPDREERACHPRDAVPDVLNARRVMPGVGRGGTLTVLGRRIIVER